MSLNAKLAERWEQTRRRDPEVYGAYRLFLRELKRGDRARRGLGPGAVMPDFTLPNAKGHLIRTRDLLAGGPLVLSFISGGWCAYCRMELEALQEILPAVIERGATLVAITPETASSVITAQSVSRLDYEILTDAHNGVALLFGLVYRVPDFIHDLWLRRGIDLGARHGSEGGTWLLSIPATYIIDRHGLIHHAHVDSDFRKRMEPADILARLDATRR